LIGGLFAIAVQISRYMSSIVWIFASTTLISFNDRACAAIPKGLSSL
jgi:hypothetical protein